MGANLERRRKVLENIFAMIRLKKSTKRNKNGRDNDKNITDYLSFDASRPATNDATFGNRVPVKATRRVTNKRF